MTPPPLPSLCYLIYIYSDIKVATTFLTIVCFIIFVYVVLVCMGRWGASRAEDTCE